MTLVALDTETTGLDPDLEDVFEVAAIHPDRGWMVWRIEPRREVVARMHPKAAEVNRYHIRTADPTWEWDPPEEALDEIADVLDGAHLLGAVPDFDARHLTSLYRRFGRPAPRWHYHLVDIEAAAVGWLAARGRHVDLPWNSNDLSRACGVEPPSGDDRHTALADARWARDLWVRIQTGAAA